MKRKNVIFLTDTPIVIYLPILRTFYIHVSDENGNDIPDADISLLWLNGTEIASKSTNGTGFVIFENMPEAVYSIKATSEGYRDQIVEFTLTRENQVEEITIQSIPFIETPLGIVSISGAVIAIIVAIALTLRRRKTYNSNYKH